MPKRMSVRRAYDDAVDACTWLEGEHIVAVVMGRNLATAIDGCDVGSDAGPAQLARLSLELRQVLKVLGVVEAAAPEAAPVAPVAVVSPLDIIRSA